MAKRMTGGRGEAGADEMAAYLAAHPELAAAELLIADMHGIIRGKWAPPAGLKKAFGAGVQLPLSIFGLDVWGREVQSTGLHIETGDRDGMARAVAGSLRPVTWARRPSAQVLMSMHEPDGSPCMNDPRHVLGAVIDRFSQRGLTPVVAFEIEFHLLRPSKLDTRKALPTKPSSPERQRMYELAELEEYESVFADIAEAAGAQDIPIDTIISEAGPDQFEVNLLHKADALAAASDALLLRRLIRGVARRHGLEATFMAKPFGDAPGNGMHVHVSLLDREGLNIFAGSETARAAHGAAIAGLLATMPDALAFFINSYNGYRRLTPGSYAPTRAIWGHDNRSVAVRVPVGEENATRVEHRIAGADANPYLVLTAVLAGILHGLNNDLKPPAPVRGNAYEKESASLTNDMGDALAACAASSFVGEAFGEEFRRIFCELKQAELAVFDNRITFLEYDSYL